MSSTGPLCRVGGGVARGQVCTLATGDGVGLLKAWRTVATALSPQMGKRPQKRSRSQALCQFHALRWLQVEAGRQARWDSLGRLMAGWSCYLSLKQRAPNRKEEQQKPSPVCSSEKAPVRMRPHQPLWLLATAHLPSEQCRLHTAPWSMDSWKCLTKSPPKGSILIFFFFWLYSSGLVSVNLEK